jgi:hypothetical protein
MTTVPKNATRLEFTFKYDHQTYFETHTYAWKSAKKTLRTDEFTFQAHIQSDVGNEHEDYRRWLDTVLSGTSPTAKWKRETIPGPNRAWKKIGKVSK